MNLTDQLLRQLADPPPARRCGIHGDDTTGGRCATCDAERRAEPVRLRITDQSRVTMAQQALAIRTRADYVLKAIESGQLDDAGLELRRLDGIQTIAKALEGRIRSRVRRQAARNA